MSWTDRYDKILKITTGDGKEWQPSTEAKYLKEIEYHGTGFEFIDINGQLVKKQKLNTRRFPLEFYFVGDLHLDIAGEFEESALDPRPWIIEHPYYNTLLVQVLSLKFDNAESFYYTKINCIAQETIKEDGLSGSSPPFSGVVEFKSQQVSAAIISAPLDTPTQKDIDTLKSNVTKNKGSAIKIIQNPIDAEGYFNAFNTAQSAINSITATPIIAMQQLSNIIKAPSRFYSNVMDRIRVFINQFEELNKTLVGTITLSGKQFYSAQAQLLFSGMCESVATPLRGDYSVYRDAADTIQDLILNAFRTFRDNLDELQNSNATDTNSFIPDHDSLNATQSLVNFTLSNMYLIALSGRKKISYTLLEDSNFFLLTHRFIGLDKSDININEFINTNKLTWEEIALGLKKNREISYYV